MLSIILIVTGTAVFDPRESTVPGVGMVATPNGRQSIRCAHGETGMVSPLSAVPGVALRIRRSNQGKR
jgi:hypothetical protein